MKWKLNDEYRTDDSLNIGLTEKDLACQFNPQCDTTFYKCTTGPCCFTGYYTGNIYRERFEQKSRIYECKKAMTTTMCGGYKF